jgi:hypothetical protein
VLPDAEIATLHMALAWLTQQLRCLCRFDLYGQPSAERVFIFNGDYVDRGAWGVETLLLLAAWKWALPHNVFLLRG